MEFHVSRAIRQKTGIEGALFNYAGNVVFGNLSASREFVKKFNEARAASGEDGPVLHAGQLFAMGLIDELNHAMVARFRETLDPQVLPEALRWFESSVAGGARDRVEKLLLEFTNEFPNQAVYQGKQTSAEWLAATTPSAVAGSSADMPNREAAVEELLMLWLANVNPAFAPFKELFDDRPLEEKTIYKDVTAEFPHYFATRPKLSAGLQTLLDVLQAPMLASPDSLSGQLAYMRDHWVEQLGPRFSETLKRTVFALDIIQEEEVAIWMMFHPNPGAPHHRHGGGKFTQEGFLGDEFVGFGDGAAIGADGARHGRPRELPPPLNEYEAFSPDQAWMPTVVMIAKSTYVWLEQLSKKYQRHIHRLDQIPGEELALLADRGINALWLIGLWERSTASQTIKRLMGQHDAVASAYSLKDYRIAEDLGGTYAYERLRDTAARHGVRLASDMVPNHMGIDSTWVMEHPEWFLSRYDSPFPVYSFEGPDLSTESRFEIKIEDHYFSQTDAAVVFRLRERSNGHTQFVYHGNDGTTFAWNDTAQLDYSKAFVREHVIQTILNVAKLFPIIRFDAAMTLAKKHVQRLWFPLPGVGGSIPSRAESAISQAEFDAMMPNEFWREVVDRVAAEVPGTLLLAEAFWLLEGYFVRTLGMHRVYNSAFMNMLRDEENAKYRSYLKKTIEFDPDILKRYVNFMSNPDERTAIDQFGTGDKYFGTCTMLATIPGLPMFGHGQIEAFTEKYGMEYKRARYEEWPNEDLVGRHQREIAPLLKNRQLFAESHNFVMYDFWVGPGDVNENVFVYSNRVDHGGKGYGGSGVERALVIYNNSYTSTRGTIHVSVADMDKFTGQLRQRTLGEALHLASEPGLFFAWTDSASRLQYLRGSTDFEQGFTLDLRGYQYAVLLDWRELHATAEEPWDQLAGALHGAGVHSLDVALSELRLRPLHEALRQAIAPDVLKSFMTAAAAENIFHEAEQHGMAAGPGVSSQETAEASAGEESDLLIDELVAEADALATYQGLIGEESALVGSERVTLSAFAGEEAREDVAAAKAQVEAAAIVAGARIRESAVATTCLPEFAEFCQRAEQFFAQAELIAASSSGDTAGGAMPRADFVGRVNSCRRLASLGALFGASLPEAAKRVLPSTGPVPATVGEDQVWAAALAWLVIDGLAGEAANAAETFDQLHLRSALAEIFSGLGLDRQSGWRVAARVRVLLAHPAVDTPSVFADTEFWSDGDVRWLACLSEANGITYVNKECFEELICWLQLPRLLKAADLGERLLLDKSVAAIGEFIETAGAAVLAAGYDLAALQAILTPVSLVSGKAGDTASRDQVSADYLSQSVAQAAASGSEAEAVRSEAETSKAEPETAARV